MSQDLRQKLSTYALSVGSLLLVATAGLTAGLLFGTLVERGATDRESVLSDLADAYALDLDATGQQLPDSIWSILATALRRYRQVQQLRTGLLVVFAFSESNCHRCVGDALGILCEALRTLGNGCRLVAVGSGTERGPVARFLSTVCPSIPFVIDSQNALLGYLDVTKTPLVIVVDGRSRTVLRLFFPIDNGDIWYSRFVHAVARLGVSFEARADRQLSGGRASLRRGTALRFEARQ